MRHLQFLIFELAPRCGLASRHALCPVRDPRRWRDLDTRRRLDDDTIVECARRAYAELGFRGLVGFHFYNEPLESKARMLRLIRRIREAVPASRFVLWTNGVLVEPPASDLSTFDQIWVSNYESRDFSFLRSVTRKLVVIDPHLDGRRDLPANPSRRPCYRPYVELIVDAFGNTHVCSIDWQGRASPGNVHAIDFEILVERHVAIRDSIGRWRMRADAPAACLACDHRYDSIDALDEKIALASRRAARPWARWLRRLAAGSDAGAGNGRRRHDTRPAARTARRIPELGPPRR